MMLAMCLMVVSGCKSQQQEQDSGIGSQPTQGEKGKAQPETIKKYDIEKLNIGDEIVFGRYEQDDNRSNDGEEIEWTILDKQGDRVLVISKYVLEGSRYNDDYMDVTWEQSLVREWLNTEFINDAFSESEQAMIPKVLVTADKNPEYDSDPGNDTEDKIFLLSVPEVEKYFASDEERLCTPTDGAKARKADVNSATGYCFWSLRTPGNNNTCNAVVYSTGEIYNWGHGTGNMGSVRPAMWIEM